jgi:CubicO group peptidase (beta-lactamase class C family)
MPVLLDHSSRTERRRYQAVTCASALVLSLIACSSNADTTKPYLHAQEPIGDVETMYSGKLSEDMAVTTFRNIDRLFPVRTIKAGGHPFPLPRSSQPLGPVAFDYKGKQYSLDDYVTLNHVTGLLVLKDGKIVTERYEKGNTADTRWMSMSVAKSMTSTLMGAALQDGSIKSLDDKVTNYLPSLAGSGYEQATVRQVLAMRSGVKWSEKYADPTSDRRMMLKLQIAQVPGSALKYMASRPSIATPGTLTNYSTGGNTSTGAIGQRRHGQVVGELLE